jgi:hypothetical protein
VTFYGFSALVSSVFITKQVGDIKLAAVLTVAKSHSDVGSRHVLRHFQAGSAKRAALVSSVPIINAGWSHQLNVTLVITVSEWHVPTLGMPSAPIISTVADLLCNTLLLQCYYGGMFFVIV